MEDAVPADPIFFCLALSLLLAHEMDAVRRREWRLLPLLARVPDGEAAHALFTALHVPIYALLLWGLLTGGATSARVVAGLDIFCVVHLGLHLLFLRHPLYEFRSPLSWALIAGAAIAGAIDLLV
jgi:hypothetical protein